MDGLVLQLIDGLASPFGLRMGEAMNSGEGRNLGPFKVITSHSDRELRVGVLPEGKQLLIWQTLYLVNSHIFYDGFYFAAWQVIPFSEELKKDIHIDLLDVDKAKYIRKQSPRTLPLKS